MSGGCVQLGVNKWMSVMWVCTGGCWCVDKWMKWVGRCGQGGMEDVGLSCIWTCYFQWGWVIVCAGFLFCVFIFVDE